MANRKNKRAYLDDFQRDLNGNYQYCGAHCHYVGKTPRKTVLLRLWLLCGGAAALTAGAGFVPGATAHMPAYVSLSYVAALLAAVYALYTLLRMTAGGEPLRAYLHEQTAEKLPGRCTLAAVLCAVAAAGQGVATFAATQSRASNVTYRVFLVLAAVGYLAAVKVAKAMAYEKR